MLCGLYSSLQQTQRQRQGGGAISDFDCSFARELARRHVEKCLAQYCAGGFQCVSRVAHEEFCGRHEVQYSGDHGGRGCRSSESGKLAAWKTIGIEQTEIIGHCWKQIRRKQDATHQPVADVWSERLLSAKWARLLLYC